MAARTLYWVTAMLCTAALLVAMFSTAECATIHKRRAVSAEEFKICHKSTPCAWHVYVPFTRRVEHIMKNTCECPADKVCIRTDDDLSISAYVYRCRTPPQKANATIIS